MGDAWDRMVAGELYRAEAPDLLARAADSARALDRLNAISDADRDARHDALAALFGHVGENVIIRSPFYCDYGRNISIGDGVFINFGAVILDVAPVRIGAGTRIGPNAQILTADHPRDPETRKTGLELGRPITIADHVWIGGGAIILPGVSVGESAIIGAGAVVTRDVLPGATVMGVPARPIG